jgi:hypothetical protein
LVDVLFRPEDGNRARGHTPSDASAQAEAGRILDAGLAQGEQLNAPDRDRLVDLISANADVSHDVASGRVDGMQADVQAKTRQAADIARKITSYASLWIAFSLLFGVVVSMIAAVMARNEDEREVTSGVR